MLGHPQPPLPLDCVPHISVLPSNAAEAAAAMECIAAPAFCVAFMAPVATGDNMANISFPRFQSFLFVENI